MLFRSANIKKLDDKLNTCLRVALLLQAWLSIPPKILPIRSHFRRKLHLFDFSRHKARDKSGVASQSQAIRLATIAPMRRKAPLGTVARQPGLRPVRMYNYPVRKKRTIPKGMVLFF